MNLFKKLQPEWILRITLGVMYLYSGQDLIRHPTSWTQFIPFWLRELMGQVLAVPRYIQIQGAVEIILGLTLLAWFLRPAIVKLASLLASIEFLAILILALLPWSGANFLITFRDIGLLGASFALYLLFLRQNPASHSADE